MMLNDPHDHLDEIEQQFQTHINAWQSGAAGDLRSLYAPPGGGKTWLLQRWSRKWPGLFFDLSENAGTPAEYIRRAYERIKHESQRCILYLDNVPPIIDEHTEAFQDEILLPMLKRGSLVIQCQTHPNQTCWGGAIPHPAPHPIPGLTQSGMMTMRKKHGCSNPISPPETLLFAPEGILPGLVKAWCQGIREKKSGQTVLRDYLSDWWVRFESEPPENFSKRLYLYAMLACCNLVDPDELLLRLTPAQKDDLAGKGVRFNERGLKLTLKLKRLQWMQADNSWSPLAAAVLKTWLSLREPELYQAIT